MANRFVWLHEANFRSPTTASPPLVQCFSELPHSSLSWLGRVCRILKKQTHHRNHFHLNPQASAVALLIARDLSVACLAASGPIRCQLAIFVTRLFLCSAVIPSACLDSLQLLVLRTLVARGRYGCGILTWSLVTKGKRVRTLFRVRTLRLCCNSLDAETPERRALPVLRTTRLAAARRPLLPRAPVAAPRIRRTSRSSTYGR